MHDGPKEAVKPNDKWGGTTINNRRIALEHAVTFKDKLSADEIVKLAMQFANFLDHGQPLPVQKAGEVHV